MPGTLAPCIPIAKTAGTYSESATWQIRLGRFRDEFVDSNSSTLSAAALAILSQVMDSSSTDDITERKFRTLANEWKRDTAHVSSDDEMSMHPAYQRIIGFGPAVIPYLLADLRDNNDHWFWALRAITGENPVPDSARGKIIEMADAWVKWGRARGYIR